MLTSHGVEDEGMTTMTMEIDEPHVESLTEPHGVDEPLDKP
jgi:hypothetical protein